MKFLSLTLVTLTSFCSLHPADRAIAPAAAPARSASPAAAPAASNFFASTTQGLTRVTQELYGNQQYGHEHNVGLVARHTQLRKDHDALASRHEELVGRVTKVEAAVQPAALATTVMSHAPFMQAVAQHRDFVSPAAQHVSTHLVASPEFATSVAKAIAAQFQQIMAATTIQMQQEFAHLKEHQATLATTQTQCTEAARLAQLASTGAQSQQDTLTGQFEESQTIQEQVKQQIADLKLKQQQFTAALHAQLQAASATASDDFRQKQEAFMAQVKATIATTLTLHHESIDQYLTAQLDKRHAAQYEAQDKVISALNNEMIKMRAENRDTRSFAEQAYTLIYELREALNSGQPIQHAIRSLPSRRPRLASLVDASSAAALVATTSAAAAAAAASSSDASSSTTNTNDGDEVLSSTSPEPGDMTSSVDALAATTDELRQRHAQRTSPTAAAAAASSSNTPSTTNDDNGGGLLTKPTEKSAQEQRIHAGAAAASDS
ncbi:MAG TPA: hypothetical protein VLG71_01530 [Candidatus Limnocylindria bacterium]|nr:hypothetical protein [Candidatus Limnocylindria bacterium]